MPDAPENTQITEANERVIVIQNPSEAKQLRPPKPLFIATGGYSGANTETQAFELREVPRTPAKLRELIKTLRVQLAVDVPAVSGGSFKVDVTLTGTTDEWIDQLCAEVPELKEKLRRVHELKAVKRELSRTPGRRRELATWCKGLLPA